MESVKKWLAERTNKKNGLYVHYSPPRALGCESSAQLRQWVRAGAASKLERAVLAGQGRRVLAETETLPMARPLPPALPTLVAKCAALHAAVERGSLAELQELLNSDYNRRKSVMCRDEAGVGLLHKAVYYDYMDIAEWLVEHYPQLVHQKDSEGRTALHYSVLCRDAEVAARVLERAGAARGARDAAGRTPAHYRGAARTLLALPTATPATHDRDMPPDNKHPQALVIKRHNIRIWCHDCDMARLQRVVWEGHGARLLSEVSSQPVVKKFLEAVPYIMNTIREIHNSAVQNDLEGLMKHTADPVPPQALSSRDANFMTVLHKAAGLGHTSIVKYIATRYPQGINDVDNDGRTALHYAAIVKDDRHTFNTLVGFGADEGAVDNKNRTPGYYLNRPQEIDKNIFKILPEAPRTPSSAYPSSWDWKLLDTEVIAELNKKSRKKGSNDNSSNNKTNSVVERGGMKASSTHEYIKGLPDLDDSKKPNENLVTHKDKLMEENEHLIETVQQISPEIDEKNDDNHDDNHDKEAENLNENDHDVSGKDDSEGNEEYKYVTGVNDTNVHNEEVQESHEAEAEKDDTNDNTMEADVSPKLDEGKPNQDSSIYEKEHNIENNDQEGRDEEEKEEFNTSKHNFTSNEQHTQSQTNDTASTADGLMNIDKSYIKQQNSKSNAENESIETNGDKNKFKSNDDPDNSNHNGDTENTKSNHYEEHLDGMMSVDDNQNTKSENENGMHHLNTKKYDEITANNNKNKDAHDNLNENNTPHEESDTKGGNINSDLSEDDNDVQVQGDSNSEYSDSHLRSTAEATDTKSAKRGIANDGRSTQDSLIEGIINGDAEEETQDPSIVNREGSVKGNILIVDNEIDPEVTELIKSANMEMLAALVLNGEGARLVGRSSKNTELQAFLDNVPTYMQKINRVHMAAKDGNIKDLQAALDRRKFAIARDPISPNGTTPLHVATVFGKTKIVKYLGGRFPETLSAVDFEGRTALHYAAVLPDNGHYYNLLQQLGANSKDLDDNGRSAEEYYKNPSLFPYKQLLAEFDISEEAATEILSDKIPEDHASSRRELDAPEVLDTLERCYRLLASARSARTPLSASSNISTPPLVLGKFLKRPVFEIVKKRVTKRDHDLFDVIWPAVKKLPDNRNIVQTVEEDFPGGITAPDYYVYEVFHEFLKPLIKDLHNINLHFELQSHPRSNFNKSTPSKTLTSELLVELNVDPNDEYVLSGTIECSRNLNGFELPINLKIGKLESIERIVTSVLMREDFAKLSEHLNPESDQKGGSYYTLNEVLEKPSEICVALASAGLLIALCDRGEIDDCTRLHGKHWPYGRGVYVSDDKTVAIWINVHDHIRVITATPIDAPGTDQAANGHMDIPIFRTEEGRYLAKSLGDPLIKGLTEVANAKPKDPVAFLASFLQNFPDHEKPRLGTQETNVIVTSEAGEVENEQPPPGGNTRLAVGAGEAAVAGANATKMAEQMQRKNTAVRPRPIDVITVDPQPEPSPDAPEMPFSSANRDEHGQSLLHFAAARAQGRGALLQLLREGEASAAARDELYRTARDVSVQANVPQNTAEIDSWLLQLAATGNSEKIMELLLEGYDHILDVVDEEGVPVTEVVVQRGNQQMASVLAAIPTFQESRESLHAAARRGDLEAVKNTLTAAGGRSLARAKNFFCRTALHVAVLAQHEDVVDYLAQNFPELLRIGDNLERTPLHYAMGVDKMESLSRVLIKAGAKRVLKDLKGRQPSYYFMNKSDILRLQEEEEIH